MSNAAESQLTFKQRALAELKEFWIIALYLTVFLGCFNLYRRLVLSEVGVPYYLSYGFRLVEALIVAKVILIGEWFGLGKRFERGRLVYAVLLKAFLFGVFIMCFGILESVVEALFHHQGWQGAVQHIFARGIDEMLARTLVLMVGLIPFFAFIELDEVLGPGKLAGLMFSRREPRP